MKDAAMNAGAWGFKLVGSGGGGCTVAWGPKRDAVKIAAAIRDVAPSQITTWMIVDDETSSPNNSTDYSGPHIVRYS
jgi:galactokinase